MMHEINRIRKFPYLASLFLSYLMLGATDVIHHLHAYLVLQHESALHAVVVGLFLLPMSVAAITLYIRYHRRTYLLLFLCISVLAALVPGIYHGGWHHLVKVISPVIVNGEVKTIFHYFPYDNFQLWFYELSGILEFFLALLMAYFFYQFVLSEKLESRKANNAMHNG